MRLAGGGCRTGCQNGCLLIVDTDEVVQKLIVGIYGLDLYQ